MFTTRSLKTLGALGLVVALSFAIACSKKVKPEDKGAGAGGAPEGPTTISTEALNFNPAGSDSGAIAGLKTVNFAYDSSTLDSSARGILAANATWIKGNANVTVQVEGHCDGRGSVEYNLALGERRAKAVKDYLVNLGIEGRRLTVISYGKEKLLDYGDSEGSHNKNRRANFVPLAN